MQFEKPPSKFKKYKGVFQKRRTKRLYERKEIIKKYGTWYNLEKAIKNKEIFKLANGIYSDKDIVDPMAVVCKKYPSAIITMDSAFYYYDLTDVIPTNTYIATNNDLAKSKVA